MAFDSLRAFVERLEAEGELLRVTAPVSPHLEITEIADRQCKAPGGGKALLFEQVEGSRFPVLINAFGSFRRLALAFGGRTPDELAGELAELLRPRAPAGLLDKLKELPGLARLAGLLPKHVRRGAGQEVVWEGEQADLGALPVLHCWPGDGGRFITLPQVYTKDPDSGVQNCGMYRLQLFSARETGMHWHPHHDGAAIYRKYEQRGARMEAAVALGGDPALTYAATAPLPAGFDELILAGYLRDKPVELVRCRTVDLHVPADADFILEGYVDPGERRREGPFGDHTGYYSLAGDYPVFHLTALTHRREPIYPATVVGRPPMEDAYLGKATERLFLPLLRMQFPEILDLNLPLFGVFHNFAFVRIRKQYPHQARKVMHGLWGLGQMALTKFIVVVDEDTDVQNSDLVLWRVGNNVDPRRDVELVQGPLDVLDHASDFPLFGHKVGIDATKKWPTEGYRREWPGEIGMSEEIVRRVTERWAELFGEGKN